MSRKIANGLQKSQKRDELILKQVWAARPLNVRRAMLDFKPSIVHFCGHGEGEEGLAFEDEAGKVKLVETEALSGFFALFLDKVECIVLNACYSEVQAAAISRYINYVVGMKKSIGDTAAIEFLIAFYDALGAGESIDFAYRLACNAIQWMSLMESSIPTLKSKPNITSKSINTLEGKSSSDSSLITLDPNPKLLCLLLLDVSLSMSGAPIEELNAGLESFVRNLREDSFTVKHIELALVTFGSQATIARSFTSVEKFDIPKLISSGATAMGEAISLALDLINRRKQEFKEKGVPYYRPFVLLVTDGSPTDAWHIAVNRLHNESSRGDLSFIAVGMESADMNFLSQISPPGTHPIKLKDLRFSAMFRWLSGSMKKQEQINSSSISLPPINWGDIFP